MIIHVGDTLPKLTDTITLQGEVADLETEITGLGVTFAMTSAAGDEITGTATVIDAANGLVEYAWLPADTATAGVFYGGWQVTHDSGTFTSPGLSVTIYDPALFWASPQDVEDITGSTLATNDVVRALQQAQDAIKAYVTRTIVAPAPVRVKRAHALLAARIATAPKDSDGDSSPVVQESLGDYSVRYSRPSYSGTVSDPEMHEDVRRLLSPWKPANYNSSVSDELGGVEIDRNTTGYSSGGGVSNHADLLGLTTAGAHPASAITFQETAELVGVTNVQAAVAALGTQTADAITQALNDFVATNGTSFLSGVGDPQQANGNDGDFWLNRSTLDLFGPKASSWPAQPFTNLTEFSQADADALYAVLGHNHDGAYATASHNHDGLYDAIGSAAAALATAQAYTPAVGTDWTDPDPTTVAGALDDLAASLTALVAGYLVHTHGADDISVGTLDGLLVAQTGGDVEAVIQAIDNWATVATTGAYSDLSGTPTIPTDYSAAATYTLIYNGVDDYDPANSGTIPSGAPRRFVGDTDPTTAGGGSFTLADGDEWIDTSA